MKHLLSAIVLISIGALISCAPVRMAAAPTMAPAALPVPPAMAPTQPGSLEGGRQTDTKNSTSNESSAASAERMIVYTVNLRLEVQDTETAVNNITSIASQYKGYVAATNLSRDTKNLMHGTITLRIPAESLDAAQKQIEALSLKVLNRNKDSHDVTDQYTDLNARLTNLTATETELRKLLETVRERSGKAEDILAVYRELTDIRTQIEQIKGQMNVLEKTSTLATVTVELIPHEEVEIVEPEGWLPSQTARQALHALVQALQGLGDLAIWLLLFFLPVLVLLLLPFVILALIVRALLRRRAKRKNITEAHV